MIALALMRVFAATALLLLILGGVVYVVHAAALTRVSDLISTSAPSATSTHTISFTATQAIPPSGAIVITPHAGRFTIPSGFDYTDVDVAVSSGGPYVDRVLAAVASAGEDGVSVTTGTLGSITVTLSSGTGIVAGERVLVELGTHATYGETGDLSIMNPHDRGSYRITITTKGAGGGVLDGAQAMIAVVPPVSVLLQNENEPPVLSNGLPSGQVAAGNSTIELSLETNELAECRYSTTPGVDYGSMTGTFTGVGGQLFYTAVGGHQNSTQYHYYVRCADFYDTVNSEDYEITFSLAASPISNTSIAQTGSETVGAPGPFPGGSDVLYLSKVELSGLSSPQSSVAILKDGKVYTTVQTASDGTFGTTISGLERGSYSFLAYVTDRASRKSAVYSSTLSVSQGTNNSLSNVVISPTIGVAEESVAVGADAQVQGESVPQSTIEVYLFRPGGGAPRKFTTTATADGAWELIIPASELSRGTYRVQAVSIVSTQLRSDESTTVSFGVGEDPSEEPGDTADTTDINGDSKVNLTDFSIMLSSWDTSDPGSDFNADGIVNLADFSILLFNWTG